MNKNGQATQSPGTLVRTRRKELGWTQEDLAAACGVKQGAISDYERGRESVLGPGNLIVLALHLELDARDLDPTLAKVYAKTTPKGCVGVTRLHDGIHWVIEHDDQPPSLVRDGELGRALRLLLEDGVRVEFP